MSNVSDLSSQYLTFRLMNELYGCDILQVREVLKYREGIRVPKAPDYVLGVINLRGGVVPIVDLRTKFGMTSLENRTDACIIILELDLDDRCSVLGVLVDEVRSVVELSTSEIEPPPKVYAEIGDIVQGMGRVQDSFVILLNLEKIFRQEDIIQVMSDTSKDSKPVEANS
jgi:purine-binding chemotaxis protein CheW